MRRTPLLLAIILLLTVWLTGCGPKSSDEVIRDVSKRLEKMESYKSKAKMQVATGNEPQEYDVEVWYQQPHFYRVSLKNKKKEITQVLLRNDDGVYVITPHLDKSFRFQSDWPEANGQIYLYQTLMNSIIEDKERQFEATEGVYQFEVAASYKQHQSFQSQKIWMKQDLSPDKVEVYDENHEALVTVTFDSFEINPTFDADAFDLERNRSAFALKKSPSTEEEEKFSVLTPGYVPEGSRLTGENTVESMNGKTVVMRYQGDRPFTLAQSHPSAVHASLTAEGTPIDLGFTYGVMVEMEEKKRLTWTYEGTQFELYGDLPEAEMEKIAQSVVTQPAK
ncbi:DUF4367 domain-containing protein [Mechercharimyces sp. CAU 1602]|uniref:DUF4367 domain-containing protein n=1 Tax=Mechercharimyces sp. CAU 1602 TaxID=2973933 RepID=UPI0021632A89|nr:DUF4367 domain-containing protein [Mechercharimyces sp. CAU 1602]MCS1352143.1 DUF4367 domain-containing protein [Mechercharimyces sp. CAU 1602]